jgi:phosphatidylglycerophosphate synthase
MWSLKYIEIRNYLDYHDKNPFHILINEINFLIASFLFFLFKKLRISANQIDVISIIYTTLLAALVLNQQVFISSLAMLGLLFIDVFDILDGQIARATNTTSSVGKQLDIASQTINHDIIYIMFGVWNIVNTNNSLIISISFVFIILRVTRLNVLIDHLIYKDKGLLYEIQPSEVLELKPNFRFKIASFMSNHSFKYIILIIILEWNLNLPIFFRLSLLGILFFFLFIGRSVVFLTYL